MPKTLSVIGIEPQELRWVRTLVQLLRHSDPGIPELARQALIYLARSADESLSRFPNPRPRRLAKSAHLMRRSAANDNSERYWSRTGLFLAFLLQILRASASPHQKNPPVSADDLHRPTGRLAFPGNRIILGLGARRAPTRRHGIAFENPLAGGLFRAFGRGRALRPEFGGAFRVRASPAARSHAAAVRIRRAPDRRLHARGTVPRPRAAGRRRSWTLSWPRRWPA